MKHLIVSLFLLGSLFSIKAQSDSVSSGSTAKADSVTSNNNANRAVNDTKNNMRSDSTGSINNSLRSDSTGMIKNNSNMKNPNWSGSTSKSNSGTYQTNFGAVSSSQTFAGQSIYASLPVLETYVPGDVVSMVKSKYKSVYDITAVKESADQMVYVVRYGDNGVYKTEKIGQDGNVIQ